MSAPASVEDVAEQLRIYAAVTLFLWGMGYYCLCRQSNGMKALMNQEGKRAKYAAARMYDGKIVDHLVTDFCKKVAVVRPRNPLKPVYRPGDNHVEMDKKGVGMFCFAERGTLFLVIIDPHDGVKPPAGVTYERKLNLMAGAGEDSMIAFSVYSVPASSSSDLVVTFVVDALRKHLLSETDSLPRNGEST
ncbi:transmembrane protein, putative [Bodo saltans]|uniref:Transmembrane protein, putative n=1 Tax=Bodo saltans TaxID=75058 RepID=A0A0S4J3I0_BODSA|nr:transmembrane protein, putative [Bodo saltans]|eukprot:CUG85947.1 transmembrane protein, putative [Bodo saltans]